MTVALDVTISEALRSEGIARELVNRVQNLRKDSGLEVTDRIVLKVETSNEIKEAIDANRNYICNEVLANDVVFDAVTGDSLTTDLVNEGDARIELQKA